MRWPGEFPLLQSAYSYLCSFFFWLSYLIESQKFFISDTNSFFMMYTFYKDFNLFLERGKWGRKGRRETSMCKRNIDWLPLSWPPSKGLARNPGTCPHRELNRRPFGSWDGTQPYEQHQSGLLVMYIKNNFFLLIVGLYILEYVLFPLWVCACLCAHVCLSCMYGVDFMG